MERRELELRAAAVLEQKKRRSKQSTVFGIVCPEKGHLHSLKRIDGEWLNTDDAPDIYIAAKMERVLISTKRLIVLIGGRGSTKSVAAVDVAIADAKDNGSKTYCLREFQSSIKNSVHSLVKSEVKRFGFVDFEALAQSINYKEKSAFEFAGIARNIDSVKSTHGFKRFEVEEAQFISQESLDVLTPSLRNEPKNGLPSKFNESDHSLIVDIGSNQDLDAVSIIFIANPGNSTDPFSKRFIEPYKKIIDRDGYYEDDLHLIVKINYTDNPWFEDSGLDSERVWDFENRERAYYDHKWLGEYNDTVEDAIIKPEWFDACIDAHIKLGFKAQGIEVVSHDSSDTGPDSKGLAYRHGVVFKDVRERTTGNVNDGGDWAADYAHKVKPDVFIWDGDGIGLGLRRQFNQAMGPKNIKLDMFRGSQAPDRPEAIYETGDVRNKKTNKQTFRNKRSQYYWELRDRCYRTYLAVVKGVYCDPDDLISFSSDIECLDILRAEICRIPSKPNGAGYLQIMTKLEMKTKLKIDSPNLADSVMMNLAAVTPEAAYSEALQSEPDNYFGINV